MSAEAQAGGRDRAFRRKPPHTRPPGSPCANCGVLLQGPWCHACGQSAEEFHRSWWKLVAEAVEGLYHFDGRVWRTLPDLVRHPARLTRFYIEGHRAPQIPPLRLFLVSLLLLFLVGTLTNLGGVRFVGVAAGRGDVSAVVLAPPPKLESMTPKQRQDVRDSLAKLNVSFGDRPDARASAWLRARLSHVLDSPETFKLVLEQWSERFAFLMLPIAALLLSLLFVLQRRFYLFDHTIFALHSLAFMAMLLSVLFVLNPLGDWTNLLAIAAPIHLFAHMRGVYATSVVGTLLRMTLLLMGSIMGFTVLMLGLLWVGLSAMSGA